MNLAQDCIDKSRFFLEKARAAETQDRIQFRYFLETTIVWARSVTLLLQKQYGNTPAFKAWYESHQLALDADPLARFFLGTRNFVLKQGGVSLRKVISVKVHVSLTASVTATAVVMRGYWRRRLRYFCQDTMAALWQRMVRTTRRLRRKKLRVSRNEGGAMIDTTPDRMYFAEKAWDSEPAIDLLDKYLEGLQIVVNDAAKHFARYRHDT